MDELLLAFRFIIQFVVNIRILFIYGVTDIDTDAVVRNEGEGNLVTIGVEEGMFI